MNNIHVRQHRWRKQWAVWGRISGTLLQSSLQIRKLNSNATKKKEKRKRKCKMQKKTKSELYATPENERKKLTEEITTTKKGPFAYDFTCTQPKVFIFSQCVSLIYIKNFIWNTIFFLSPHIFCVAGSFVHSLFLGSYAYTELYYSMRVSILMCSLIPIHLEK